MRLRTLLPVVGWLCACGAESPDVAPPIDAGQPPPLIVPQVRDLSADPPALDAPGPVRIRWVTEGADRARLTRDGELVADDLPPEGERTVELEQTATLTLEASGEGGRAVATLEVRVTPPPPTPRIDRFEVYPEQFEGPSAEVTLSWRGVGSFGLLADDRPVADFPGNEATFWQTRVDRATRFTLTASSAGQVVTRDAVVRRSGQELEPNDDRGTAGFLDRDGEADGAITPRDVDWYGFDVPEGAAVLAEITNGSRGCDFDSQLELWGPDPDRPGQVRFLALADDEEDTACARIDPSREPGAFQLMEGRHYLTVRGFDAEATGAYTLRVTLVDGGCGNDLVEVARGESCEPAIEGGEICRPDCTYVLTATVAGPDGRLGADVSARSAFGLELTEEAVAGARLERCEGEPTIVLLDADRSGGDRLAEVRRGTCRIAPAPLRAGRYRVVVERSDGPVDRFGATILTPGCGDGRLDPGEQCDGVDPTDADGCDARCRVVPAGTGPGTVQVPVSGGRTRYVAVDVTVPGSAITATITQGPVDRVQLGLYDASLFPRVVLNPGFPLRLGEADDLPAGRWYLGVSPVSPGPPFDVTVLSDLIQPRCGDQRLQLLAGEQCDDGRPPLPGCDAQCRLQPTGGPIAMPNRRNAVVSGTVPARGRLVFAVDSSTVTALTTTIFTDPSRFVCEAPAPDILRARVLDEQLRVYGEDGPTGTTGQCPRLSNVRIGAGRHFVVLETTNDQTLDLGRVQLLGFPGRCGDGFIDVNETCDDGNSTPGDGCHRCQLEGSVVVEQEPNDERADANPLGARLGGGPVVAVGSMDPAGRDLFQVQLGRWQEGELVVETKNPVPVAGCFNLDTQLRVFDSSGALLGANDDINPMFNRCSRVELRGTDRLVEGTYFVEVSYGATSRSLSGYRLEVEWQ